MTLRVKKYNVTLSILFIFALGVQGGFLLDFVEADNRSQRNRQSLEETAIWSP